MSNFFRAVGKFSVRFRWFIVLTWILGTIAAVSFFPSLSSVVNGQNSAFLPNSAPSEQAANLAGSLQHPNETPVLVVATNANKAFTTSDEQALSKLQSSLKHVPNVTKVYNAGISPDGKAAELIVESNVSQVGTPATTLISNIENSISKTAAPSGFSAHVAGNVAINVANQASSANQTNQTQLLSIIFILVLLLVIFRSVLAPLITLLPAALVMTLASSVIAEASKAGIQVSSVAQTLLVVLVLGAGTDYGLFLVFRVREELRRGLAPKDAVIQGVQKVGESISFSAGTVIVALLSLLLASFGLYHDLGIPLAIGIAFMLLAGLTLLPALLAILGRAVFWPSSTQPRPFKEGSWTPIIRRLIKRPGITLLVGVVFFSSLAIGIKNYNSTGFGGSTSAPAHTDAAIGQAALQAHFPQSFSNPTNLVFRFPHSVWKNPQVLTTLTNQLKASGKFSSLLSPLGSSKYSMAPSELSKLYTLLGPPGNLPVHPKPNVTIPIGLYRAYRSTSQLITPKGHIVVFESTLKAGAPSTTAAMRAVPSIRAATAKAAKIAGASANGVAGQAPASYDVNKISQNDLLRIVPIAIILIGFLLVLVMRSLVAPLYLIASVALSYLAALGLTVIIFIDINKQNGVIFILPFLMFIFLLALGEDYNILVMTRIREEAHNHSLKEAIAIAVGITGPTVTSAGLVLAGTFIVLVQAASQGPSASEFQAIGMGLALGILMDTFLVRTIMIPSIVALLGKWNWWPSKLATDTDAVKTNQLNAKNPVSLDPNIQGNN